MKLKSVLLALATALIVTGCASVNVADFRGETPVLDLTQYFNGTIDGWGMFQDRSGKVIKRFYVRIDASWSGNQGTLDEHFDFADGSKQQRIWKVVKDGDRYTGSAGDVVGTAQGQAAGNALRWRYVLTVPVGDKTWNMDMDDWMYLIDQNTMINRTSMSKLGVQVGEVTLAFRKR